MAEEAHSIMGMDTFADVFPLVLIDGDKLNLPKGNGSCWALPGERKVVCRVLSNFV